jgi:hypothetical protein
MPSSVNPIPSSQIQNRHCSLLRFRPSFLSFFKGALLPNFNNIITSGDADDENSTT